MTLNPPKLSNCGNSTSLIFFSPQNAPITYFILFYLKQNKKKKERKKKRNMLGWSATPFGLGVVQPPIEPNPQKKI
jgi:hypothetical protein